MLFPRILIYTRVIPRTHRFFFLLVLATCGSANAQNSLKFGDPGCDAGLNDREAADRKLYQFCHSFDLKVPLWVGYVLTRADLDGHAPRPSGFVEDKLLKHAGSKDSDYVGGGFSRGHMAPAADFSRSKTAIKSTFILSNVVPQFQGVNGGRWAQLELAVRNLARQAGTVFVFTGPLFEDSDVETIGDGQVGVPTHTFKVVMTIGPGTIRKMYAVIMPNQEAVKDPVNSFVTTVRAIEEETGFDFFSKLDSTEQDRLETAQEDFPTVARKLKPAKNTR